LIVIKSSPYLYERKCMMDSVSCSMMYASTTCDVPAQELGRLVGMHVRPIQSYNTSTHPNWIYRSTSSYLIRCIDSGSRDARAPLSSSEVAQNQLPLDRCDRWKRQTLTRTGLLPRNLSERGSRPVYLYLAPALR
jgi:hypothetical protein